MALQIGFQPNMHDSALFLCRTSHGLVLFLVHVDDMIIIGFDSAAISAVKRHLFHELEVKDLGHLQYFLGIEIASFPQE